MSNLKFVEYNGKHVKGEKTDRIYLDKPNKNWRGYGAKYPEGFMKVDIDDFEHKTEEPIEPIHGQPRSDAVAAALEDQGVNYLSFGTESGKHFIFRRPTWMEPKNRLGWISAFGVRMEYKFPERDDHLTLKVNGIERKVLRGSLDDLDAVDELPAFLWPLQKSRTKPFLMEFPEGDRTQALCSYLFHLASHGYTADQAFQIVRTMNRYVFDNPIPDRTLDAEILNDKTLENLKEVESSREKKEISPDTFKAFLHDLGMSVAYNELLNIVEYVNVPKEYSEISDTQNVMPIRLQYDFRKFTGMRNINRQQVTDLISLVADENTFNPVRDYLDGLTWDGTDRFPEIFTILGVDRDFERSLIRKWFFQTAALPFNTLDVPMQPEGVLILCGPEGIGKTRFFQRLVPNPRWFSSLDKELTTKNKDILIQMLSAWIGEVGEIDRTFSANKSDVKNFMTLTKDTIRKPYAREPVTRARTTSFCGTTNKAEFLNDAAGFRRWWVVHVQLIEGMEEFLLQGGIDQIWAQARQAVIEDPQCFRLSKDECQELQTRNREVFEMVPGEEELRNILDFDAPLDRWDWIRPTDMRDYGKYGPVERFSSREIGAAVRAIMLDMPEIRKRHRKKGTEYFLPPSRLYRSGRRGKG